ncbi:MAG: MnmC family methyltransferase, partial [Candidatus Methanomethylicia archaeon]
GLSTEIIELRSENSIVNINDQRIERSILENIVDDAIYILENNSLRKIAVYANGKYYKLKYVAENSAPTLEINGIHMHRIVGITPWEDSLMKVKAARIGYGMKVLDICTGLGYTAIASIRMGASMVLSIEKDINVLEIAKINPWSKWLEDEKLKIVIGDASKVIRDIESESFDRVIHDPPRFSLAGELYGINFYKDIYRILRREGILYHYTGQPGIKRRKNIVKGVSKRLIDAGFNVKIRKDLLGILAYKD